MMFGIGDGIEFRFDEHRRLRFSVPGEFLPLAAWLHTDAQPDAGQLARLIALLERAKAEDRTWYGNGCSLDLVNDVVLLESLYGRWERAVLPESLFWPVLHGLREFVAGAAAEPGLRRPADYPEVFRAAGTRRSPVNGRVSYVDHTYFPAGWRIEDVHRSAELAWQSPELVVDEKTGAWSGMAGPLEIAGYCDPATGEVQTYFPVLFRTSP